MMFSQTATYYDKIYSFKDYQAEVLRLLPLIGENRKSESNSLLDIACGTGLHVEHLKEHFYVEGLDLDPSLLELARQRNPGVVFHQANMTDFHLHRTFDVITCLFSSIGYVKTLANLQRAIRCMAGHQVPGGLLIIEPWFTPEEWRPETVHGLFIDEPNLKIARVNTSFVDGRISYFDLHYLVGTPQGTEHFVERHELGLFESDEMHAIMEEAGLDVSYDDEGLMGRGLFLGTLVC